MPRRSPIAVLSLLALTHFVTVLLFLAAAALLRFDPANFFVMFLVPAGALLFGLIGSLGAFPGARLAQYPPEGGLRTMMAAMAAGAYALYLLIFAALTNWASPGHPGVLATLVGMETQGEFVLSRGTHEVGNLGQMGSWGYLLLGLKFAGVAGGALAAHASLRLLPYCASCRVFTRTREKGSIQFASIEDWIEEMRHVPEQPWLRARHLLQLPRRGLFSRAGKHSVQVRLRRHECPDCNEQHMRERVFVHNGRVPVEEKQLSSAYSWFPDDARSTPKPAPEAAGGPRVFGRKVA